MSVVTRIQRRSRLSTLVDQPGGISAGVGLARARANLQAMEGEAREIVAHRIADLASIPAPQDGALTAEGLEEIYRGSAAVIDAAGPFALADLCTAAAGLCDLTDGAGVSDWRVIAVHSQALRLLIALPEDLGIRRNDATRELLAAKSIAELVEWSGGLYNPPAKFRSW